MAGIGVSRAAACGVAIVATVKRVFRGRARTRRFPGDGTDLSGAARTLETFLDRLAWRNPQTGELAAEYLPDPRYAAGGASVTAGGARGGVHE